MKLITGFLQLLFLIVILQAGNWLSKLIHFPLPGSVIGLVLLFLLLEFRVIKVQWVEQAASWLIADMLLFFVPLAVGIVNYHQLMGVQGLKIISVIVLSTIIVMICTGLTAEYISKHRKGV